jgi:hypothetical protein
MKAILEFELPDDKTEFDTASKAMDWAILAWDMEQYIQIFFIFESVSDILFHVPG